MWTMFPSSLKPQVSLSKELRRLWRNYGKRCLATQSILGVSCFNGNAIVALVDVYNSFICLSHRGVACRSKHNTSQKWCTLDVRLAIVPNGLPIIHKFNGHHRLNHILAWLAQCLWLIPNYRLLRSPSGSWSSRLSSQPEREFGDLLPLLLLLLLCFNTYIIGLKMRSVAVLFLIFGGPFCRLVAKGLA